MKVVILAGGKGTRLAEETLLRPKPMVEIGGKPLIWHIMKIFSFYGLNDFIVCCGYKGYMIKEYFANYSFHTCDITVDLTSQSVKLYNNKAEPWNITLLDTGLNTQTAGRLKRINEHLGNEPFCFTYGDGVSDVDILKLIDFHKKSGKMATLTAVRPSGRFGRLGLDESRVVSFHEKPVGGEGWINGGFFILEKEVLNLIEGDQMIWEREPMQQLAATEQLVAYRHEGFWEAMDTMRDKEHLETLWRDGEAKWLK
jgi:glucose-1-phosphate cytidylyltransferase